MSESSTSPSLSSSTCPQCGAPLLGASAEGLCPRCLLALNLEEPTRLTGDGTLPAKPPRPAPSPEELAPHFPQLEILGCLGRGGMGVVYRARQKSLNRLVALKLLAPERADDAAFTARFEREAQALAALSHPNIVTIHDYGQAGGFCFLLMEFVDGVNLRQAMKASRFTPEQALAMVPPICEALQYAHEHGIVHRDIKPENLLMDKAGRVKIADFGIAKIVAQPSADGDPLSGARATLAGTPQYMAPEQGSDTAVVDHRADIYSLGVVLYEMLTGELPKGRLDPPSAHMRGLHIDVRLDEVVLRALETVPELRYSTAAEFRTQVETVVRPAQPPPQATMAPLSKTAPAGDAALLKMARGRYTTPEFLATPSGGFWKNQGMGELSMFGDRLEFTSEAGRTTIPFSALRQLGTARGPLWTSPAGHEYLSLVYDEGGRDRQLLFMKGTGIFRLASDTVDDAQDWVMAIQEAMRRNGHPAVPAFTGGPVVVSASPLLAAFVFVPLILFTVLLWRDGLRSASTLQVLVVLLIPACVFGFVNWRKRRHRPEILPLADGTAMPVKMPWWRKVVAGVLIAVAIALPVRVYVLQVLVLKSNSAAPELPEGSRVVIWKLASSFVPGDMIVYREGPRAFAGRVVRATAQYVVVRRNGTGDFTVPRVDVMGRVVMQTRAPQSGQSAVPEPPRAAVPEGRTPQGK